MHQSWQVLGVATDKGGGSAGTLSSSSTPLRPHRGWNQHEGNHLYQWFMIKSFYWQSFFNGGTTNYFSNIDFGDKNCSQNFRHNNPILNILFCVFAVPYVYCIPCITINLGSLIHGPWNEGIGEHPAFLLKHFLLVSVRLLHQFVGFNHSVTVLRFK